MAIEFEKTLCKLEELLVCLAFVKEGFPNNPTFIDGEYQNIGDVFSAISDMSHVHFSIESKDLEELINLPKPAILLLNNSEDKNKCSFAILAEMDMHHAYVILPEHLEHSYDGVFYSQDDLSKIYTGQILQIHDIEAVAADIKDDPIMHLHERSWLFNLMKPITSEMTIVLLGAFIVNLIALVLPLFVMNVYDRVVPNQAYETLLVLTVGVILAFVFDFILKMARDHILHISGQNLNFKMGQKIYTQLLNVRMQGISNNLNSIANVLREHSALQDFITTAALVLMVDIPFILFFMVIIGYLGGDVIWVLIVAVPLIIVISLLCQIPLYKLSYDALHSRTQKNACVAETITGFENLKVKPNKNWLMNKWNAVHMEDSKINIKNKYYTTLARNLTQFVQQLSFVAVVFFGVSRISENEMTIGALVACTILTGRLFAPLGKLSALMVKVYHVRAGYQALNNFMKMETEQDIHKTYVQHLAFEGNIELKNVSFCYPEEKMSAIKDISITIKRGEKIAILGQNGCGKSTLFKMLLGLYEPQHGQILIDKIEISNFDPSYLRNHISFMPQEVTLHQGTLKENIIRGHDKVSERHLVEIAEVTGVDKIANAHPKGYDMEIGSFGRGISGGQKQSINLASALLNKGEVLLLDEPTNALDVKAEKAFLAALKPFTKDKTLIVNAHTMSLVDMVDRLIVIKNGEIFADGPKNDILKLLGKGGI